MESLIRMLLTKQNVCTFPQRKEVHMSKLITVQNEFAEVSDELYEFMESDRKRQAAEERSDRRHLNKSSFETVEVKQEYSSRKFENQIFHRLDLQKLREAMQQLNDEERRLIEMYYWDEMTMQEIADVFGISKMAVSKRHQKILDKMRATVIVR